jgi:hypothetical protein
MAANTPPAMNSQRESMTKATRYSGKGDYFSVKAGTIYEQIDAQGRENLKTNSQIMDLMLLYGKGSITSDSLDAKGFEFDDANAAANLKALKQGFEKALGEQGALNRNTNGNTIYNVVVDHDGVNKNIKLTENNLKLMDAVFALKALSGLDISDKALVDLLTGQATDEARAYLTECANLKLGINTASSAKAVNKLMNNIQTMTSRIQQG